MSPVKNPQNNIKIDELNEQAYEIRFADLKKSLKLAAQAVKLAKQARYTRGLARAYWNLAIFNTYLAKYEDSFAYSLDSYEKYRECNDREGEGRAIYIRGTIFERVSDYKSALKLLNRALKVQRDIGDKTGESATLNKIGEVYTAIGEYKKAKDHLFDALNIVRETGNKRFEAVFLNGIGIMYRRIGDYVKALEYMTESVKLARDIGDKYTEGAYLGNLGNVYFNLGDNKRALEYFKKALAIQTNTKDKAGSSNSLIGIGSVYFEMKDLQKALVYHNKGLKLKKEIGDKQGVGIAYSNIAEYYTRTGDLKKAENYHRRSLGIAREIGDKFNEIQSLHAISEIYIKLNKLEHSLKILHEALDKSKALEAKAELFKSHSLLSQVYEKLGDIKSSYKHFKRYHHYEKEVFNQEIVEQTNIMSARFEIERAQKEAEIYRLKNVELAKALSKVELLNQNLKRLDKEKNEFVGLVIHDLRNPLSNIFTSSNLLLDPDIELNPEERKEIADYIKNSSEQMFELIKKLLDINAIESGKLNIKLVKTDINEIINHVISEFKSKAEKKNIKLECRLSEENVFVNTDKTALELVINNLVSNAIKFSPFDKSIFINTSKKGSEVICEIQDEGPGFSDADKKLLFEKFSKLSARPTGGESSNGLGLSIVKKLLDALGGKISCESEKGKGAKFTIKLSKFKDGK